MATLTAQIVIGDAHPFHDGINPSHALYLSENGRPAWMLLKHDPLTPEDSERVATWIPSVDDMLEDGLMMIAAHVARSEGVREALVESKASTAGHLSLLEVFSAEFLSAGRVAARATVFDGIKLVVTVLEESTVRSQLDVLNSYQVDAVVCVPTSA
jgi:hypothetical protein